MFRRRRPATPDPDDVVRKVPDDLPRDGLFDQPLVVSGLAPRPVERLDDGSNRVTFRATVKDAVGKRCPDMAIEATITGPERTAQGSGTTNLMGQIRFRMSGPAGAYAITIDDVAAGALEIDREASTLTATTEVE